MASIQVRQCEKCGKIFENLGINICDVCNADIPILFKAIELNDDNSEETWYKQCPVCGEWHILKKRNEVTKCCKNCGQTAINNLGEDRVYNILQYQERSDENILNKECTRDIIGSSSHSNESLDEKNMRDTEIQENGIKYVELRNQRDGKVIRVNQGCYVLGAFGDIDNDYFYPLQYVGGKHLIIYVEETEVYIMDNNSKNKTRINGRIVEKNDGKMRIVTGDKVTMADQIFEVIICK